MSESSAFNLLDERIQHYIWSEGWTELRDAQERAAPLIVTADHDVIIAAATAAGKTEAAFLPALTRLLQHDPVDELIVYISPLKALINDQFGRLDRLCEQLDVPVWPWHGDISSSTKTRFLKGPKGVLLITPEAVEAMLCNRGTAVAATFARTLFFVIDELHAFIGSERGKQLQSLLHRIERAVGRQIPRIGLSATLGDMTFAANFLRPGHGPAVHLVESTSDAVHLKILIKGYEEPAVVRAPQPLSAQDDEAESDEDEPANNEMDASTPRYVAQHLFQMLRGSNNLVFPNSRRQVEVYTHLLTSMCHEQHVPNEFWPHHGSLSKEIRADTEAALKQQEQPATAVCTNTLELGIDIGAVKCVAQIGPPPSVASLRQRLGRSGRRKGEPAILRGYSIEDAITDGSGIGDQLRLGTVQMVAMTQLLLEKWFEPPVTQGLHLSTLVQQLLSLIAQRGGVLAADAYAMLCGRHAPFAGLAPKDFKLLLRQLSVNELILQDSSGLLLHGRVGEKFVNHYTFYAAFATEEEYRLVTSSKTLGTLPVVQLLTAGQRILFAGRTWLVMEVNEAEKTIFVKRARGGAPPMFAGGVGRVHTRVRQAMRAQLESDQPVPFVDLKAQGLLNEGRGNYRRLGLGTRVLLDQGQHVLLLTWMGDDVNEAIACLLGQHGLAAAADGPCVEIQKGKRSVAGIEAVLRQVADAEVPTLDAMLAAAKNLEREKWDWALPQGLLRRSYASLHLDLDAAVRWVRAEIGTE